MGSPRISMLPVVTLSPGGGMQQDIEIPGTDAKGFAAQTNLRCVFFFFFFFFFFFASSSSSSLLLSRLELSGTKVNAP